ncbi:MAG: hypothetical protein JRK53_02795 [Deltaproteobacteria bacterium]|nr:hypothetical protein [Deltaproteobacteria bacterium]
MKNMILLVTALVVICWAPLSATAGDFDGSKPLLCCATKVFECVEVEGCREVTPEQVNLPRFMDIDFTEKAITTSQEGAEKRKTEIERLEHIDGKLIVEGAEDGFEGVKDGLGWSMAISEETGRLVLTGSGDQVGFVVFGACTLK